MTSQTYLHEASARGLLIVRGRDRVDLLQRITTNDVKKLATGSGNLCCFTNAKGRIVDRCRILAGSDATLVVTSAGRSQAVAAWIDRYVIAEDVQVADLSPATVQVEILGARAIEIGERLDPRIGALLRHSHLSLPLAGIESATFVRTEGLNAADGLLAIVPSTERNALHVALAGAASAAGCELPLVAPEVFDARRIDAGVPLFGADFSEENNPLECGFWDSVSFEKGCYVGQEVVARLRTYDKVMKQLARLELPAAFERGTKLFADGREVGSLSSVAGPPQIERHVALGFVNRRVLQAGTPLQIGAADSTATVQSAKAREKDPTQ